MTGFDPQRSLARSKSRSVAQVGGCRSALVVASPLGQEGAYLSPLAAARMRPRHRLLLRVRRDGERQRCAAEQRDELASCHSITSSATKRKSRLIVSPSSLAVFRLMTNSNLVGCSTGKSAGLAPLRILSTYVAVRRNRSGRFAP